MSSADAGPVVVITGVSRGVGRACALRFAERGCRLALLGRPSEGHEATRRDCEQRGVAVLSADCELADRGAIERAVEQVLDRFGAPDVVINNAAVLVRGPRVHELAPEDWQRVMAVNVTAPFLLSRALLPSMLKAGRGRFIHVSSISGTIANPQAAAYGTSKWALIGFSKALAAELSDTGLQSLCLLLGGVDTDMLAQTPFPADVPIAAVADVVCYHALDAPAAMNGANIELYG